jgi:hypothetical protein
MNGKARRFLMSGLALTVVVGLAEIWSGPASPPRSHDIVRASRFAADSMQLGIGMPYGVSPPEYGSLLPPRTEHGLAHRLQQYPAIYLATARERLAAQRLRRQLYAAAQRWANPRVASAAGFDLRRPQRGEGERRVMWFHSENRRWQRVRGAYLDPSHPHTLIYADLPGRPLKLVGVMISMPRGVRGPTPGGPITRWHHHLVCAVGNKRGRAPRADGSCRAASTLGVGSEMMHVWFTHDLRSAFAVHAPWPELCAASMLPAATCASGKRFMGM